MSFTTRHECWQTGIDTNGHVRPRFRACQTDYKTGNSIHVATFYLLPPTLPIATSHTFPPTTIRPRLGEEVQRRLGEACETGWKCGYGSADDLGLVWYVRGGGCSMVAESEARGGRGIALAQGASRQRSHLGLTTLLFGFGWPALAFTPLPDLPTSSPLLKSL